MKKSLILPLVISFVLMILILTFFIQGCSRCGAVEDLDPSLLCTSEEDCVLVNCTDCSCDNFKVMNKDSAKKVCENVKVISMRYGMRSFILQFSMHKSSVQIKLQNSNLILSF